ncbi:MAG: hypothetical protein AW09_000678 [Candidatus Accumulibacter phosphatis]|uniref:Contractile injection system tube protein N-terminal domain-containing protein n=1 Tax=Candidatus Accumulibacter phosphatis TaxID=327160 RepID=A0A080LYS1_9PROT|nr:hypothetical protein [Accumulibacter sp.]KFB74047.1 MAG: hypothetical protein AW09_000678 [Candidatus Accumulibacter phosphatis]HRF06671.1 hypothetical protein [Accumulibacter sp.]
MSNIPSGNQSALKVTRGMLKEYTAGDNPLELHFEFNPSTITRSRAIEIEFGEGTNTAGGRDFNGTEEIRRVAQGATVKAETFTLKILLDATDRMNADDSDANTDGVQPELDILYSMVEPKLQAPDGASTLAALSDSGDDAQPYPSVLLFTWGRQVLPVFMTQVQFEVKAYLPSLVPYRAEATLTLQVIQSRNNFYTPEIERMFNSAQGAVGSLQGFQSTGGL